MVSGTDEALSCAGSVLSSNHHMDHLLLEKILSFILLYYLHEIWNAMGSYPM